MSIFNRIKTQRQANVPLIKYADLIKTGHIKITVTFFKAQHHNYLGFQVLSRKSLDTWIRTCEYIQASVLQGFYHRLHFPLITLQLCTRSPHQPLKPNDWSHWEEDNLSENLIITLESAHKLCNGGLPCFKPIFIPPGEVFCQLIYRPRKL